MLSIAIESIANATDLIIRVGGRGVAHIVGKFQIDLITKALNTRMNGTLNLLLRFSKNINLVIYY